MLPTLQNYWTDNINKYVPFHCYCLTSWNGYNDSNMNISCLLKEKSYAMKLAEVFLAQTTFQEQKSSSNVLFK
jgi:hypothetical protein